MPGRAGLRCQQLAGDGIGLVTELPEPAFHPPHTGNRRSAGLLRFIGGSLRYNEELPFIEDLLRAGHGLLYSQ